MDINAIMDQYKSVNEHIDELNQIHQTDYDTKLGTAKGKEFTKSLISKGKAAHRKIRMTEKQTTQIPTLNFNKEYSTMDLRR